jgi:hypothetical protein
VIDYNRIDFVVKEHEVIWLVSGGAHPWSEGDCCHHCDTKLRTQEHIMRLWTDKDVRNYWVCSGCIITVLHGIRTHKIPVETRAFIADVLENYALYATLQRWPQLTPRRT